MKLGLLNLAFISVLSIVHFKTVFSTSDSVDTDVVPDILTTPNSTDDEISTISNIDIFTTDNPNYVNGDTRAIENCGIYSTCEECYKRNCTWIQCVSKTISAVCTDEPDEMCPLVQCDDTTTVPTTTTDPPDVTTTSSSIMTTDATTSLSPTDPTTTEAFTTETTSAEPDSTTIEPTTIPSPTTTIPPAPHGRHFDGASFFGGIILATSFAVGGFFGFKYYKKRMLAPNYSNF